MASKLSLVVVLVCSFLFQAAAWTTTTWTTSSSPRLVANRPFTTTLAAGPATLEPTKEKVKEKQETTKADNYTKKGGWAVRLFNDPMNKREFVAMCLSKIVGLNDGQAYQVMMQAHKNGVSVVGRFDFERAELYRNSLVEHGLLCDMIPVDDE